jgi:hypothetical protein
MIWHLNFKSVVASKEFETAVKQVKNTKASFSYQIEDTHVAVEVKFSEGDYTTAYDATWQLVRHVEETYGQIESIEGVPRQQRGMQLLISKHVRSQEGH